VPGTRVENGTETFVSARLTEIRNENENRRNEYESGNHQRRIRSEYVMDML
jgi:hypothetical protein